MTTSRKTYMLEDGWKRLPSGELAPPRQPKPPHDHRWRKWGHGIGLMLQCADCLTTERDYPDFMRLPR